MLIDVVVPVFNGSEHLSECIRSVRRCTKTPHRILVVDDASTDGSTLKLLDRLSKENGVVVLKQQSNQGFVAAANRGMQHDKSNDVILLNSDTVVTKDWLEKIRACAYSNSHVASVSPLTSYGSIFSVPKINSFNPLPDGFSIERMGELVENLSKRMYPEVPTTNGFCMYIKREALNQIGFFDKEAFGRGYGEENDLCMRARENGWIHLADDSTYVYHHGKGSFGADNEKLRKTNRLKIDASYPYYTSLVKDFIRNDPLRSLRQSIGRGIRENSDAWVQQKRRKVLFILHKGAGGTIHTTRDLIAGLGGKYECLELKSDRNRLFLHRHRQDGTVEERIFLLSSTIEVFDYWVAEYRQILLWLLKSLQIDLLHVRHLLAHPFDAVEAAHRLGIPTVLSFHDYYTVCPNIHLIDNRGRYCAGDCNPDQADCEFVSRWFKRTPRLKNRFLPAWRNQVGKLFEKVDAFVTTSSFARDLHVRHYPVLGKKAFRIIEHGRDFPAAPAKRPTLSRPARILMFGALNDRKGLGLLDQVASMADPSLMEFYCLGTISHPVSKAVRCHGPYQRDELPRLVEKISPSLALVLSRWPETYCHTLTEAWALGLPAAVSDIGTLRDRMSSVGGGWVLSIDNPETVYRQLLKIVSDEQGYRRAVEKASQARHRSVGEMASDYDGLYRELLSNPKKTGENLAEGQLLYAQETALRAEKRHHLASLKAQEIKALRVIEKRCIEAMEHFIKPTLKKNQITYRLGRWVKDIYRKILPDDDEGQM